MTELKILATVTDEEKRILKFVSSTADLDRADDIVYPWGADLSEFVKNPVFLYAHNRDNTNPVLGKVISSQVESDRLVQEVEFWKSPEKDSSKWSEWDKFANMLYFMYRDGIMKAVSIGFKALESAWIETTNPRRAGYDIKKWRMIELSACPIGMNQNALTFAKSYNIDVEKYKCGEGGGEVDKFDKILEKCDQILKAKVEVKEGDTEEPEMCEMCGQKLPKIKGCGTKKMISINDMIISK